MKISYKSGEVTIEVEGKDTKDCFAQVAGAVEIFGNGVCGACDSTNVVPNVRNYDGNTYYSMTCRDCGSSLNFGQRKQDGGLYPRKKDKDGNWLGGSGWVKYRPREESQEEINF